jgi:SAM-dependent methyltransferase
MQLHPLAAQFAQVAEAYERGRPEYAPAVVGAMAAELGVPAGAPVLDLAAGTGKLTRALLGCGLDVLAVEPQAELRGLLAATVGPERVVEGLAEAIPAEDGSFAVVTVADAFHWFDQQPALAEMRRVLRPGGGLAVLDTTPDWSGASWAHEVGSLIVAARPDHPHFDGPPWTEAVRAAPGWGEPWEVRVTCWQPSRPERIADWVSSLSWVAGLPDEERGQMLAQVDAIVAAGETPAEMAVHVTVGLALAVE